MWVVVFMVSGVGGCRGLRGWCSVEEDAVGE